MRPQHLLFIGMISLPLITHAQFQNNIPQVKPLSPDATAMFKVLERPLGTYTGTIPISFPLLSLSNGTLSANLSLDYNSTGGIRVEEIASGVGLGFSFNDGGGRIVQTINGLADDMGHGLLNNTKNPSAVDCGNMSDIWISTIPYQQDLEPDIFMYNFNGKSGRFFFKENGTIAISENAGIKIEYDTINVPLNGIRQWIITDEKGSKYYFGQDKSKTNNCRAQSTYEYRSVTNPTNTKIGVSNRSWYLLEVNDVNEENSLKYSYVQMSGETQTYSGGFYKSWTFGSCTGFNTTPDQAWVYTDMYDFMLSKIDGGGAGYILINSAADRLDGTFGRKVNNLELYDSSGVFKKRVKFNYGYFNAGEGDPFKRRLKLNNFAVFGNTGTDSIAHKFTYNEVQNLPARLSNSVDLWGYFNYKSNTTYFPNVYYNYAGYVVRDTKSADRTAVPGYASANILTRITYPTGGYRQFTYEGNTALMYTNNEHYYDANYTTSQGFTNYTFYANLSPQACLRYNFTINSTDGGTLFTYSLDPGNCGSYTVKLYKTTTATDTLSGSLLYTMNNIGSMQWSLLNGYYRIEVYKTAACNPSSLSAAWKESTLNTATITTPTGVYNRNNINAGGVRIKQISDYDPITNKTTTTDYRYKLYSTDSNFTSGVLITPVHMVSYENPGSWDGQFLAVHTSSCYPLATESGSYVVYPEVRTIENGNGRVDRVYSFTTDYDDGEYPPSPLGDNSYLRGRLMKEMYYDQSGTLLRKTVYEYTSGFGGSQIGIRHKPYYYDIQDNGGQDREWPRNQNEVPVHADCHSFYVSANSSLPYSQTDSVFSATNTLVTKKIFTYYNYKNQLILNKVTTNVNGGSARIATCKYSFTDNSVFSFFLNAAQRTVKATLLGKNILQPLEITDSLKPASGTATLVSGNKYVYGTFNSNDLHLAQAIDYSSPTDSIVTNFTNYDFKGNLREQYQNNDVKTVYLWGYKGQYPVAIITGATYARVNLYVSDTTLYNARTDSTVRVALSNLRTNLGAVSKAQITSYTYLPLVGMNSATDPSGKTIYYEYDAFGRLLLIREKNNNILKKYEYKLAGF